MASTPIKKYWDFKPDDDVELDLDADINEGLIHAVYFNSGGLLPTDLIQGNTSWHSAARPTDQESEFGRGLRFAGAANSGVVLPDVTLADELSLFVISSIENVAGLNFDHMFSNHNGWFLTAQGASAPCRVVINTSGSANVSFGDVPIQDQLYGYGVSYDGATVRTLLDGEFKNSAALTGNITSATNTRIGQFGGGGFTWPGAIYLSLAWARGLSDDLLAEVNERPLMGLRKRVIWTPVSAPTGITGTSTTTNANDVSNASGSLENAGTSTTTNANDTSDASGTLEASGTSETTNADDASNAVGVLEASGTSETTNANDSSNAFGVLEASGNAATINADDTSNAAGIVGTLITGTSETTNANDDSNAAGVLEASGNAATTNANDNQAAAGTLEASGVSNTVNINDVSNATGIVGVVTGITGTSAAINDNDFSRSSGIVGVLELGKIIKITHFDRNFEVSHPNRVFKMTHYNRVFKVTK